MREPGQFAWRNPWCRFSVLAVCGITAVASLVGFVWLPSAQSDFGAQGIWASICRAAGVPGRWAGGGGPAAATPRDQSTTVVLDASMAHPTADGAAGRGATLAFQRCTMCHGARGVSQANAPNLAGQHAEVVIKQLTDYRHGGRTSAIMQAVAQTLTERDVVGLAAYYASLPQPPAMPASGHNAVPTLVAVGDPMRNIAPCASCHGASSHKLGAPWLEGLPNDYLTAQLTAFATGVRSNDSHAQMRNMARQLSSGDIAELAAFYSRR